MEEPTHGLTVNPLNNSELRGSYGGPSPGGLGVLSFRGHSAVSKQHVGLIVSSGNYKLRNKTIKT